jgi:hypothetical protein
MKKFLISVFFLTSFVVVGQEKLIVANETEVYDNNGNLFRFYGHGATLKLIKKYADYAEVEIEGNVYKVPSKFYENIPKITIKIGMSISDLVSILGTPTDTLLSETKNSIYWTYIYGKTYYHFENSKLTTINRY